MTPTVHLSPLGNSQPYEPGTGPQSSSPRPFQLRSGAVNSPSSPRSTCPHETPTTAAQRPADPSAPTTTPAVSCSPDRSRTCPPEVTELTAAPVRTSAPAPAAASRRAASKPSRSVIPSPRCIRRVTARHPSRVRVSRSTMSWTSGARSISARSAERRTSPPPHVLYRGGTARSSSTVRAPPRAAARAADAPAGPPPTTTTS